MAALALILFIVSAISVSYPLKFLMIRNRLVAICGVFVSFLMIGTGVPSQPVKNASAVVASQAQRS